MRTELDENDFWNGCRYYLTDGVEYMTKKRFLMLQKKGKKVFVVSDENNIFDVAFEVE